MTDTRYPMANAADAVSPELVLVDPALAERERRRLLVPATPSPRPSGERHWLGPAPSETHPAVPPAEPERTRERVSLGRARAWRLPIGVGAVVVLALLLLDVRVEVGKNPASAVPGTGEGVSPAARPAGPPKSSSAPKPQVRRFAWAPAPGAARYRVEIFEGSTRVFVGETRRPQISVPRSWVYGGATRALVPGEYRWYVWPIVSGRRSSRAVVQASLSIPAG